MRKIAFFVMSLIILSNGYADTIHHSSESKSKQKPKKEVTIPEDDKTEPSEFGALTGTFDITSNYVFRGLSLSNNLPAFQGGLTYTVLKPGIYFNFWGSTTYLTDSVHNETATVEIDSIVGITNKIGENFNYDISLARYNYPKATSAQYNELLTKLSYTISSVTLTGEIDYSNNVFNSSKPGTYYTGKLRWDIPSKYFFNVSDVSAFGSLGHYNLPKSAGLNSFNDYMFGLSKNISIYTLALQWTTTDGKFDYGTLDDSHVFVTLTANF